MIVSKFIRRAVIIDPVETTRGRGFQWWQSLPSADQKSKPIQVTSEATRMAQGTIRQLGGLDDEVYLEFADGGANVDAWETFESRKEQRCSTLPVKARH